MMTDEMCTSCLREDTVEVLENDTWEFPAQDSTPAYMVTGMTCYHCTNCGEKFCDSAMDKKNHPRMVEAKRQAEHLLSGDEIREIAESLPYSEKEIEKALGFCITSFSRWKSGRQIQNPAADSLLIAVRNNPKLIEEIAARRGIILTGRRKGRPKASA